MGRVFLLAAVIAAGTGPAFADGNRARIVQSGLGNGAALVQRGERLSGRVRQVGSGNLAATLQSGDGHRARSRQSGTGNVAAITQSGAVAGPVGHVAIVHQRGSGHVASVRQSGSALNVDAVIQSGTAGTGDLRGHTHTHGPVTVVVEHWR